MYFLVWNAKEIQQKIAILVVSIFGGVNICFLVYLPCLFGNVLYALFCS